MLVPTKRRFDITAFFNSYSSEKIEWTSTRKSSEDAIFFSFNSYSVWSKIPEMELPLKSSAMTLFLFQILVFCSEVVYTLVPDADQVAKNLNVSHFDCGGAMMENTLYALNQVRQCHITPEEMEISQTKIILYTKLFRKELNATKCRIQHQREKWHCGHNDHSSIDHTIAGITSYLVISPEQCRSPAKGKSVHLTDQFLEVKYDTKDPILKTDGFTSDDNRNHCNARGWITRDTFLPHMQRTALKVRMSTGKVLSDSAQVLSCALEELGCETTSLDPYAYIWVYPDNCVLSSSEPKTLTW